MAIPESQLETWSHQGAVSSSAATYQSIRTALTAGSSPIRDRILAGEVNVYLQGSYRNDTNIRGDSDVDAVVELSSTFYSNLTEAEKRSLYLSAAVYSWADLRRDVITALQAYYGAGLVNTMGNKSLKVASGPGRLAADVVPACTYKSYRNITVVAEGITFWTQREGRQVINFPKLHYDNGVGKHSAQQTNGWYKPTVRIFKNARTYLVDRGQLSSTVAPSYFLECLLYNVPTNQFGRSYQETFCNLLNWLNQANLQFFICQNGQLLLFGQTSEQWSEGSARELVQALIKLWNNWS